jgi:hypothetical protein
VVDHAFHGKKPNFSQNTIKYLRRRDWKFSSTKHRGVYRIIAQITSVGSRGARYASCCQNAHIQKNATGSGRISSWKMVQARSRHSMALTNVQQTFVDGLTTAPDRAYGYE